MIAVLPLPLIACGKREMPPTAEQLHAEQQRSTYGPTSDWRLSDATWSRSTQKMRDRAYLFCWQKRRGDPQCPPSQDFALILANHAESNARAAVRGERPGMPFFDAIRQRPDAYIAARQHCMIVYQDGGAADARSLGPCLTNAVGGDYFGIVPVP
ncbi:hypothetical protein ACFX59_02780 [Sphingomonas sp. NCPPB 2930]|uniref:hypothetical protein n=1 Tax=Sphingomonas sp. NCPPB 2930 TaxID=3162788 RepID=UPI0036DB546B